MTGTTTIASNTPTGGLLQRRCDPFGAESGGPRRLLGGLYGPEHVGKIMWHCENAADARYRMACRCGHRGQEMWLCLPHRMEIARRQAGLCPACAWPPQARAVHEAAQAIQAELQRLARASRWATPYAESMRTLLMDYGLKLDEMNRLGQIHRCPLELSEVSLCPRRTTARPPMFHVKPARSRRCARKRRKPPTAPTAGRPAGATMPAARCRPGTSSPAGYSLPGATR